MSHGHFWCHSWSQCRQVFQIGVGVAVGRIIYVGVEDLELDSGLDRIINVGVEDVLFIIFCGSRQKVYAKFKKYWKRSTDMKMLNVRAGVRIAVRVTSGGVGGVSNNLQA